MNLLEKLPPAFLTLTFSHTLLTSTHCLHFQNFATFDMQEAERMVFMSEMLQTGNTSLLAMDPFRQPHGTHYPGYPGLNYPGYPGPTYAPPPLERTAEVKLAEGLERTELERVAAAEEVYFKGQQLRAAEGAYLTGAPVPGSYVYGAASSYVYGAAPWRTAAAPPPVSSAAYRPFYPAGPHHPYY